MARTAAQTRYVLRHKAKLADRQKAYRATQAYRARRRANDAQNRNQRNSDLGWRWMAWSERFRKNEAFEVGVLSLVNLSAIENPQFIFIHRGKRSRDTLHDPLPSWEPENAGSPVQTAAGCGLSQA